MTRITMSPHSKNRLKAAKPDPSTRIKMNNSWRRKEWNWRNRKGLKSRKKKTDRPHKGQEICINSMSLALKNSWVMSKKSWSFPRNIASDVSKVSKTRIWDSSLTKIFLWKLKVRMTSSQPHQQYPTNQLNNTANPTPLWGSVHPTKKTIS